MPTLEIINALNDSTTSFEDSKPAERLLTFQRFEIAQKDETDNKKALATKFAINELKLNHWSNTDADYQEVYQVVWLEKMMFVEMSFTITEINDRAKLLLSNQKQMINTLGLIVSRTGEILANQTIIITKLDEIKVVVDDIKVLSEEILVNTETIITKTDEILANQYKFMTNGITVRDERKGGGSGGSNGESDNTMLYVIGGGLLLLTAGYFLLNKD